MTTLRKRSFRLLLLVSAVITTGIACNNGNDSTSEKKKGTGNPKIDALKLPDNFTAERLYSPGDNKQGSWVSMAFDDKGRMIVSDQYGYLYRLQLPAVGEDSSKLKIEQLRIGNDTSTQKVSMGYAQGLLYAFNSLYVMVNHNSDDRFDKGSGLYRLQDTNGDDQFDKITLLKKLDGEGEHGPHSIVLSPDKKSIYVIAGNFTKIPEMNSYKAPPSWNIDNILPFIKDPNGHDNTVNTHGGWIAHLDSTGTNWELISSGFRNPFDMAFNDAGDLFTYDSDMEWDFGTPWYRPTRICQVTSGSEYGWRPGTEKWSPAYPDNLPPLLNIGQGCPTNLIYGGNARFPEKYRKSLFAFDWSFGIIYSVSLQPDGASYKSTAEEFLSGSPLPLTDGMIGPDGALYFLTGGRRLESDLYRVYYKDNKESNEPLAVTAPTAEAGIRKQLETYHGGAKAGAVDFAWPYLKHSDRFIRFAARIAIENQPVSQWQNKLLQEKDPETLIQGTIALARQGKEDVKKVLLPQLMTINYAQLSPSQQIDLLRAFELVFVRMGKPDAAQAAQIAAYFDPAYPASTNDLNRSLSKVLVYLNAPKSVEKTMALLASAKDDTAAEKTAMQSADLIMRNPQYGLDIAGMLSKMPPLQQTWYATVLSQAKQGWTPELQDQYFKWFYNAFTFKGGHSFVGFINTARKNALANVPKSEFAHFNTISGDSLLNNGGNLAQGFAQPKGPGRNWNLEEALKVVDSATGKRDFEQGRALFNTSLCSACHGMRGEGGVAGPDLTQLGTRFSSKDILEAIIEPSKTISDQYEATVFSLKNGSSVVGRMVSQDKDKYVISQNPFATQDQRELLKKDVTGTKASTVSVMLPGLINRLNPDELRDLMAYLKAGGNKEDSVYKAGKQLGSK
ncbi:c-type cytochrome [Chitinophaga arvensicola]|uniref:Putative heme-binding domain-containing protein n=1 Tax=Chitinophaga arvensicola TaxID=29529 RepID=A0A1I0S6S4_9BACT|nr:c-type cytochrome [Chitinophaga arvensicola]SEW51025.1 putative heme-binding domain-containing protein [Chitinophaga arvensicola]